MSNITIKIETPVAYVSLDKFAELSGIPLTTCRGMVADGRIIIRPKKNANEKVMVNMIAMTKDATINS